MADIVNAVGCAVRTTYRVGLLPAIPTQDWVTKCAQALSGVADQCMVISLVCTISSDTDRIGVISSGVAFGPAFASPVPEDQRTIALQDRCERLSRLGLNLPPQSLKAGLVAPLEAIENPKPPSPISRLLKDNQATHTLIHIVPISTNATGLCQLNIIGFSADTDRPVARRRLNLLRALHKPLSERVSDALSQVTNPRAWLTDREQGVLDLLIEGHSVRVIAEQLGRSAHTVHDHVKNLHKKIGASSRGELIAKALGHKQHPGQQIVSDPVVLPFSGDQFSEMKPANVMARPLRP